MSTDKWLDKNIYLSINVEIFLGTPDGAIAFKMKNNNQTYQNPQTPNNCYPGKPGPPPSLLLFH